MGLFDFFKKKDEGEKQDRKEQESLWLDISEQEQLEELLKKSEKKKVYLFKNSTRCFISKSVLRSFEQQMQEHKEVAIFYLLDVVASRELSQYIAQEFGIEHQSPQLLIFENRKVIYNASHESIDWDTIPR